MSQPPPRGRLAAASAALLTVVVAAACSAGHDLSSNGPLMGLPDEQGVQVINSVAQTKPVWHYGSWTVCVEDDKGPVTLDAVAVSKSGKIDLTGVGVKKLNLKALEGSMPGPIPSVYADISGFVVSGKCADNDGAEIVLQLNTPKASASLDDFTVRYHRGSDRYTAKYAARIVLCVKSAKGSPEQVKKDCAAS